jgi:3D (Asp-Asp-Asp) domain-containing protein
MVNADGHRLRTRTRGETVGDALVDLGVFAVGSDRVTPSLESRLVDHMEIAVTRVRESILVEREVIPYDFIMVPDDGLEIDHQRLARQGQDGEFRTRYRLVEEDGVEVVREMTDAWVAAEPVTRVTAYGRQLISRPLETPDGAVSYWRKIRMYATSYSPARSGTPKSAPWYGRTRLGLNLRKGIVAVDTSVIPLRSRVYVPGYGIAIAGDTGGGVRGKWIDLGFEDHDYESWHRWVDVYVLDPPPAARQIRWVLPNYPPPGFPRSR